MPCPHCGTENPSGATVCGTCVNVIGINELVGATHRQHLAESAKNSGLWRVATAGPGYIVVAAPSRGLAAAKGAELLGLDALDDQTVTVTEVSQRGRLVYVRSALSPYPSARKPWQVERDRRIGAFRARAARRASAKPAPGPVAGRQYIGQVQTWLSESRHGTIACADRTIGVVAVGESGLRPGDMASVRTGQYVTFTIEQVPDGLVATDVRVIGLPAPAQELADYASIVRFVVELFTATAA